MSKQPVAVCCDGRLARPLCLPNKCRTVAVQFWMASTCTRYIYNICKTNRSADRVIAQVTVYSLCRHPVGWYPTHTVEYCIYFIHICRMPMLAVPSTMKSNNNEQELIIYPNALIRCLLFVECRVRC